RPRRLQNLQHFRGLYRPTLFILPHRHHNISILAVKNGELPYERSSPSTQNGKYTKQPPAEAGGFEPAD
ncbi:hypothetical protein, partial [Solidesulfovibrio aerotolerans]|uniref:hypothetical protein n=1 Tax=Solidesulfovibrio aerotolerans TaxID=295255 RepID=UPI001BAA2B8E